MARTFFVLLVALGALGFSGCRVYAGPDHPRAHYRHRHDRVVVVHRGYERRYYDR